VAQTGKTQAETELLGFQAQNEIIKPHLEAAKTGFEMGQKGAADL
jgi:hypothetical protein